MFVARLRAKLDDPTGNLALIRRMLAENVRRYHARYAAALWLMALSAACTAIPAYLVKSFVNETYLYRNFSAVVMLGVATLGLFVLKGASIYGQMLILARINTRIVADSQRRMFDKLMNEGIGFFDHRHSSEFIARLTTGANAVTAVLNMLILAAGRDVLTLIGLAIVMVVQDPLMFMIGVAGVPPALLVMRKLVKRIRTVARDQFTGGTRMLEALQEAVQGIRIVKAFTLEDEMRKRFEKSVAEVQHESFKLGRVAYRSSPLMETIAGVTIAATLVYAGHRVIHSGQAAGEFMSFLAAFAFAFEPAKRLARLNLDLNTSLVGARVLYELIDAPPSEPIDETDALVTLSPAARIEFSDVRFSYRPGEPVLRGMSFVAEPGKITALVGPSGGGKTTVLALLLRFYEMESGTILIDGHDTSNLPRRALRRQIGYVGQHVHLFRGSIRDNIAFGKVGATDEEIVAAAKAANAHDFIMSFPAGYDTPVGEHGLQLSGGQRQRVAIARALIKDAPIILLDEATAALDSESEQQVQDAMAHLCQGRTTLVIAHRLHTIIHADRILVVEGGIVVETGRHEELLRKGSRYAGFYRVQLRGQAQELHEPAPALASSG